MYEALGDGKALALINRLFKALDQEVQAAGGVTVKTLGDGMVCQFGAVDAAFRAACNMQEAAARMSQGAEAPLRIKIGCNFGPVVLNESDVFGDTVNVCARLVSLANPAQVLTTRQMIEGLSPGLRGRCRELYVTKVRGRMEDVVVCEVLWRIDPDMTKVDGMQVEAGAAQWVLKLSYGGESYRIERGASLRLGREASNDIVVPSDHASRTHARIYSRDNHFVLADQSANGTYVMDDATQREVRLRRSEAVLGERGWIGLGQTAAKHGDHVVRYSLERG